MSWIKQFAESRFTYLLIWLIAGFLLFLNGINSFISSSEFWSIYLSQKIFSMEIGWQSVYLKPIFHGLLATVYLLNLNDFYHIVATKVLFALNGLLQFILIFRILSYFFKKPWTNLGLTIFLFCSPLLLGNYDRVRSDQLALTIFLFFALMTLIPSKNKPFLLISLLIALPLVAFKHIYFSVLGFLLLDKKPFVLYFNTLSIVRKFLLLLGFLAMVIWGTLIAIPAIIYFINSMNNYRSGLQNLYFWGRTEWFYLYIALLPLAFRDFRIYLKKLNFQKLLWIQYVVILILLIHPQRFNFFIASFIPVLYLPALFFVHYLIEEKIAPAHWIFSVLVCLGSFSLYLAHKESHVFTFNNPQLVAIDRISNIVTANHLSYLDGMGLLPKGNNVGCFVSPEDDFSNQSCINAIKDKKADAIIVTNRLMSLNFDFNKLEEYDYISVGPNFYIRKDIQKKYDISFTSWAPPSVIFSSEQIY